MTSRAGSGLTSATKDAVGGLSEALIDEVAPLGIHVTILEPGLTATSFVANMQVAHQLSDYEQTVGEGRKAIAALPPSVFNNPERVADAMLAAVDADNSPRRLPTGSFAAQQIKAALNARLEELDAVAALAESVDDRVA